ncbi:MAG: LysR family transcriptional regulator [Eggerthellaceae bacterium]
MHSGAHSGAWYARPSTELGIGRERFIEHQTDQVLRRVANRGSLSSAAREHGISVQAVSKSMADLEFEFERTCRSHHQGIELTPLGGAFLKRPPKSFVVSSWS